MNGFGFYSHKEMKIEETDERRKRPAVGSILEPIEEAKNSTLGSFDSMQGAVRDYKPRQNLYSF